jgi:hypothetical protein
MLFLYVENRYGIFLMLLLWYTITSPTTDDTQHFFAECLFSFENKVWQIQI